MKKGYQKMAAQSKNDEELGKLSAIFCSRTPSNELESDLTSPFVKLMNWHHPSKNLFPLTMYPLFASQEPPR